MREPIRFEFEGYSVWLELEGAEDDFLPLIQKYAHERRLQPIPFPHITAIYGMNHLPEEKLVEIFQTKVQTIFTNLKWPEFHFEDHHWEIEMNGVNDGLMDMAWMGLKYYSSPQHQDCIDKLVDAFYRDVHVVDDDA